MTGVAASIHARQFIVGPTLATAENLTASTALNATLRVACHPGLATAQASGGERDILCLGEVLDPRAPDLDNAAVVRNLHASVTTFADFESATARLGGRWIMIVRLGSQCRLYPDATGLKSVFHVTRPNGEVWAGSQPGVLGEALGIAVDEEIRGQFLAHPQDAASWPGETTPYPGVRQLLPNHFLDLVTGQVQRFWPTAPLPQRPVKEAAAEIAELLHGQIAAVLSRGSAAMALTAGYDSRTLFASARELRRSITLFRVLGHHLPSYDTAIPRKLVRRYGLSMREVRPQRYPPQTWETLQRNVASMWWDPADYMLYSFGTLGTKYILFGWLAEVGRCFYYRDGNHPATLSGESLARVSYYKNHPMAVAAFDSWLAGVPQGGNPATLDLFYWEHRAGNWASMMATAYDAIVQPMAPYNCRELLTAALSVDVSQRREPYELQRQICAVAAPETLRYPFNYSLRDSIGSSISSVIPWRIRAAVARWKMRAAGFELPRP